ncbi:TetR/AcrR family transcriptional regulator [Pseudomonas sp. A-R-19]|uniref:TetR/AcrR family transcriptional regulator n=1 Tax=Pseudomonas sp. A-R-19 TaxID=2832403 RepID=UPI001CBE000F|nr:TetR/AcrR family transcriptional regulator [Pseudomonas sp. A-R-19]
MVLHSHGRLASKYDSLSGDISANVRLTALNLFVAHGYQAVGLRQIAQGVGLKPGYLYNRIEGKEYLLFELIHDFEQELSRGVKQAIARERSQRKKLMAFVSEYTEFSLLNRDLHTLAIREGHSLVGSFRDKIYSLRNFRLNLLKGIAARECCEHGVKQTYRDLACEAVIAMLSGMLVDRRSDAQSGSMQRVAGDMAIKILCGSNG